MLLIPIIAFVSYTIIQKFKKQKPLEKGLVDQTTVEPGPLFCKDCKHCISIKGGFGAVFYKCGKCKKDINPKGDDYLVTGVLPVIDPDAYYYHCSTARSSEYMCGKDASHFEPKETNK